MHSCYISKLPFSVTGIKLEGLIFKFHQHVLQGELPPAHTAAGNTTALGIKNSNRATRVEDQAMHCQGEYKTGTQKYQYLITY